MLYIHQLILPSVSCQSKGKGKGSHQPLQASKGPSRKIYRWKNLQPQKQKPVQVAKRPRNEQCWPEKHCRARIGMATVEILVLVSQINYNTSYSLGHCTYFHKLRENIAKRNYQLLTNLIIQSTLCLYRYIYTLESRYLSFLAGNWM